MRSAYQVLSFRIVIRKQRYLVHSLQYVAFLVPDFFRVHCGTEIKIPSLTFSANSFVSHSKSLEDVYAQVLKQVIHLLEVFVKDAFLEYIY